MGDIEAQNDNIPSNMEVSPSSFFKKPNHPIVLKFEDVYFKIRTKKQGLLQKKSKMEEKTILKGINGIIHPGEMLAVLGPSGSGKTTLLTALGGRLAGELAGTITYNGKPFSKNIKRNMGFVTQDDILIPQLTVIETLVFTAFLRLPNTFTKEEKKNHAEGLISELGLKKCRNSIVGDEMMRGISGGERKRVCIGQEMLINPSLLFLDEPTSGLDSTTAQRIVSTLMELSNGGRTIVMTIHQPSSRIFYMFHKIMLLSEGNVVYFGKGSEAMGYFSTIGYSPSVPMNPSDFLLDLANGIFCNGSSDEDDDDEAAVKQKLVSYFKSNLVEKLKIELLEETNKNGSHHNYSQAFQDEITEAKSRVDQDQWSTTWWQQFCVLSKRRAKVSKHSRFSVSVYVSGSILAITLLAGFIWFQTDITNLTDQVCLLFFMTVLWTFQSILGGVFTFLNESKMLFKERVSRMYRLSSYFMAITISEIYTQLLLPTIFVIFTYWMSGLKRNPLSFISTLLIVLLNASTCHGLGMAIGAITMQQRQASAIGLVIAYYYVLVGGFWLQNMHPFVSWLKYFSVNYYGFKLILASQFKITDTYPCSNSDSYSSSSSSSVDDHHLHGLCRVSDFPIIAKAVVGGNGVIATSVLALVAMFFVFRVLAYVALLRIGVVV